ncbi:hypothetical protein ThrDRAFT_03884 [Frankia casuarinae]|nr:MULTISPECIES: GNAT family N-acetyltransferase [Frankia]ETA02447.1 hypothetical protein CcI6DRAFT_02038 [Frankia sp. CcI6]EYT90479.1 hypothetical protein ThrDRAFT_03884 [Frankia casuarinae]KDA43105.1 hypothetical protein BMG523Draft_01978 [Frankia sp. BMG5.23]KFB04889.1 hypothetical protein ALLO2DRAFT_02408 [Frankia sp. Allo2]TFE33797.1 N-acetyltransferase [Frankia sp. B2]
MRSVSHAYPGDLTFRRATEADVAAIVELVESAYRGESSRAGWTTEADLLAGRRTDAAAVGAALAALDSVVLLAQDPDGALLGCCHVERRVEPPARSEHAATEVTDATEVTRSGYATHGQADAERCGPDVSPLIGSYFGMFAVSPTRQGNGLGDTLLRLAERHAVTACSAAWTDLLVIAQRAELIAWYQRRGYVLTTRTSPFPYDDERFGRPLRPDLYFVVLRKRFGDRPGFSDR